MPRRHLAHADKGGGRKARPLGVALRIALALLAAGLLAFALQQTIKPEEEGGLPALTPGVFEALDSESESPIDWAALPEAVVAWVEVPGTSVDEPIAQATAVFCQ